MTNIATAYLDEILKKARVLDLHFHNGELWFGLATAPSAETHRADRIGAGVNPFQIDAGNNAWGTAVCILGSDDSDSPGITTFDIHAIQITSVERDATYFIQIGYGANATAAFASPATYTEKAYKPQSSLANEFPLEFKDRRLPAGTKMYARCFCPGQNTATLDFYFGAHGYNQTA